MGINYSPKIVTDGLILYLDAANPKSYPGNGNVWKDLSKNKYDATIFGTNVWNNTYGGQFDFGNVAQTSQYIKLPHQAAQSTGSVYTMEFWMKPIASETHYFCSMATSSNNNYFIIQQNLNSIGIYLGTGTISYSNNEYFQFCVVRNGSDTGTLYKNGNNLISSTNTTTINQVANDGWILNQEQDIVGGNFDSTQNYRGAFMIVKLYNKALTAQEIQQNFQALRGRYGI